MAKAKTFRGGLHVDSEKNTSGMPIVEFPSPDIVSIPMQQHIGAPATPLVAKGDHVRIGDVIGRFDQGLSCPVHASISGTVKDIEMRPSYTGYGKTAHIILENDHLNEVSDTVKPYDGDVFSASTEDIVERVRNAGISGMGGAAFPTYAKIQSGIGKAKKVIINCAECEPYITANHRLMLEEPERIVGGARILRKALGVDTVLFAVEDNKKDAAEVLHNAVDKIDGLSVVLLKTKYPQGDERQLIYAIDGIELPAGKLPADVGSVIFNAETAAAVYSAMTTGMPLVSRVVTVDGDAIEKPQNIRAPIGTSFEDIFTFCGGTKETLSRVISGGPMMGNAQWDTGAVVMKNTSAILVLSDENKAQKGDVSFGALGADAACIHCGRCVSVCPMHLMPNYLAAYSKANDEESSEAFGVMSCVECGCCTYTCPARVPIVQHIRNMKSQIQVKRKKMAAAAAQKM